MYPQPVAWSCGRVCRARTPQDRLDSVLKCAEVLTRYACVLAIASFAARAGDEVEVPAAFSWFKGNLSFGKYWDVLRSVAAGPCEHPLKSVLAPIVDKDGKFGPADKAIDKLITLRNQLGHNLLSTSEAKAVAVFKRDAPDILLRSALDALEPLLTYPLFVVEGQEMDRGCIKASRLVLMGDTADPIPQEVELSAPLMEKKTPYLGVRGGALRLDPFLLWDLVPERLSFGLYLIHAIQAHRLKLITLDDQTLLKNGSLRVRCGRILAGERVPTEDVRLGDGDDFFQDWRACRAERAAARGHIKEKILWKQLDRDTLCWFAERLGSSGQDQVVRKTIVDRLLEGRDRLAPEEIRQVVLLFGTETAVQRAVHRDILDLRLRKDPDKRWDDRVECRQNVFQSLRLTLDFFSRHLDMGEASLDQLSETSGSVDYIAVREALINCFCHQDYADPSMPAQIEITVDRTKFLNAGHSLVSATAIIEGGSHQARNPLISRALKLVGFAELAGSGLRVVHRVWRQANRRPPYIDPNPTGNTFTLLLDWRPLPDTSDEFWQQRLGVTVSPEDALALSLAADPAGVTPEEIASAEAITVHQAREIAEDLERKALVYERDGRIHIQRHLKGVAAEAVHMQ